MSKIDITMTATLRPGIINETLESYCSKIFKERDRYRLIVNIDPVGEGVKAKEVIKVCKNYFNDVIFNIPDKPSFPNAVIWVWSQIDPKSKFVFHLEDDWLLGRDIDINDMIKILDSHPTFAYLRLLKYRIPNSGRIHIFKTTYRYNNEGFFISSNRDNQFGLNPCLIKADFIRQALPNMVTTLNPEKQFRASNKYMKDLLMKWEYPVYGQPGWGITAIDNGWKWRRKLGINKPDNTQFLVWDIKK